MTNDTNENLLDMLAPPDPGLTISIKVNPDDAYIQVSHNGDLQTFTVPRDRLLTMVDLIVRGYEDK